MKSTEPRNVSGLILAGGKGIRLGRERPKCLESVGSETILHKAIDSMASIGISKPWVATGWYHQQIESQWMRTIHNANFATEEVGGTFWASRSVWEKGAIIMYSDIIVPPAFLEAIASDNEEVNLAVDPAWRRRYIGRIDHPVSEAELVIGYPGEGIWKVGKDLALSGEVVGEFVGALHIPPLKSGLVCSLIEKWGRKIVSSMSMAEILSNLISEGLPIRLGLVAGSWWEIDTEEDLARASEFKK